jgi:hypothetical protein
MDIAACLLVLTCVLRLSIFSAVEGSSVYTLNEQGLIAVQEETWSINAWDALVETLTPTAGPPAARGWHRAA